VSGTGRTGRPSLTERRKAETRREVAGEAVRLFAANGVAATTAEEIAAAAGISVRTLWRYFPSKESCIQPVLTDGIESMLRSLRAWPLGSSLPGLLDGLTEIVGELITDLPTLLALVRLVRTEPGLRAVWLQAHDSAEPLIAGALAQRYGLPENDLQARVQAGMINVALRVAVEHHAWHTEGADQDGLIEAVHIALRTAAEGLTASLKPASIGKRR
jgi:AcrR family transcriptional regulator